MSETGSKEWRGINDFYFVRGDREPEPEALDTDEPVECSGDRNPEPECRITSLWIVEPEGGFRLNKPFEIRGRVENLHLHEISRKKVLLYPVGKYKGIEDVYVPEGIEVSIDSNNEFCGTCKYLFEAGPYTDDRNRPEGATWELFCRAEGPGAERSVKSGSVFFPRGEEVEYVSLRKGHYDEEGAANYDKPADGEHYVTGYIVKELQKYLVRFRYMPSGSEDGYFGEETDRAVRLFQEHAIKRRRMKCGEGKVFIVDKTLDQSGPDGIVGEKTRAELERWYSEDWVKPAPELYHGDYDDEGVARGRGKRGGEDYHVDTPVKDNQQLLQGIGLYEDSEVDGWFSDKTESAVEEFQRYASEGRFFKSDTDHTVVELDEKLTGYMRGVLDVPTQEKLKDVSDRGLKVPGEESYGGYELQKGDKDRIGKWGGAVRKAEGKYVEELQRDLFSLGYWITDGLKAYNPMVYDGDFGHGTYSGLKTFQYEHKDSYKLEVTGKLDRKSADALKECVRDKSFRRPGIKIDPNDIDDGYCKHAMEKPAKPERYYQLPPCVDGSYKRYGECKCSTGGELGDVYHNDIWGAKDTIDALISLAQKWKSENDTLEIGDISRWDAKKFSAHSSHLAGYSVDIRSDKVGAMQKGGVDNKSFDKDKSVKLAKMAISLGFKYIITKCPHVAAECNRKIIEEDRKNGIKMYVNLHNGHHHHYHLDFWRNGTKLKFPDDRYSERAYCKECVHKDSCFSEYNTIKKKDKEDKNG